MKKINKGDFKRLFKGETGYIVVTQNGISINGEDTEVLALLTMIVRVLKESYEKEEIETAFKLPYMEAEELVEELKKNIDKALEMLERRGGNEL